MDKALRDKGLAMRKAVLGEDYEIREHPPAMAHKLSRRD